MKLGVNLLCATEFVENEHRALLEAAVVAGYDGVEIPVLDGNPDHYASLAFGMLLALEPPNRFKTHFLNTVTQANHCCDLVDHPVFGIMYDTFHAHIEEKNQIEALNTLGIRIHVLNVSENDRGIPGTGQIDFPAVFGAIKRTGFDGWVVMEAFGSVVPELAAATRI